VLRCGGAALGVGVACCSMTLKLVSA